MMMNIITSESLGICVTTPPDADVCCEKDPLEACALICNFILSDTDDDDDQAPHIFSESLFSLKKNS